MSIIPGVLSTFKHHLEERRRPTTIMSRLLLALFFVLFLTACSETPDEQTTATAEESDTQSMEALRSASAEGAQSYFINLEDGATVSSPVTVQFGIEGMEIVPAGTDQEFSGHHHLLIDIDEMPALDMPLPADAQHVHFGKGQTEVELTLEPGTHTLQLILGNHLHIPHDPPVLSERVTITVQ